MGTWSSCLYRPSLGHSVHELSHFSLGEPVALSFTSGNSGDSALPSREEDGAAWAERRWCDEEV